VLAQKLDYVAGRVRNATEDAPNNKTPSKVLRSGKRIPLSTAKKPKSLSRLQDETLTQVRKTREHIDSDTLHTIAFQHFRYHPSLSSGTVG
jgi:hypothetical protein